MPAISAGEMNDILLRFGAEMNPSVKQAFESIQKQTQTLEQATTRSTGAVNQNARAYGLLGAALNGTSNSINYAGMRFGMLDRVLGSHAAHLLNLNYGYGIFAEELSRFFVGGLVTTGLLAGFLAIAEVVHTLTDGIGEAEKEFEKMADEMEKTAYRMVKVDEDVHRQMLQNNTKAMLEMAKARLAFLQTPVLKGMQANDVTAFQAFWSFLIGRETVGSGKAIEAAQAQIQKLTLAMNAFSIAGKQSAEHADELAEKLKDQAVLKELERRNKEIARTGELLDKVGETITKENADFMASLKNMLITPGGEGVGSSVIDLSGLDKLAQAEGEKLARVGEQMNHVLNMQVLAHKAQMERLYEQFGLGLGQSLVDGILSAIEHGRASFGGILKSFIYDALRIAANVGLRIVLNSVVPGAGALPIPDVTGIGSGITVPNPVLPAAGAAGAPGVQLNVTMPAPPDPLAAARDATWQRALKESLRVAQAQGYRFA